MDAFGNDFIAHNLPLLFISGLKTSANDHGAPQRQESQEGGFRVKTDLPVLDTDLATVVRDVISSHDGSTAPWGPSSAQARLFAIRNVGRVGRIG
jgi:hypothetical protein